MNIFRRILGTAGVPEEPTPAPAAEPAIEEISLTYERIDLEQDDAGPALAGSTAVEPGTDAALNREHVAFTYQKIASEPDQSSAELAAGEPGDHHDASEDTRGLWQINAAAGPGEPGSSAADHQDEIEIHTADWMNAPSVGAAQSLSVGANQAAGGVEHQDDWSSQGAAGPGDPNQPYVLGSMYNPATPSDDGHEVEMDVHVGKTPPPPPGALTSEGGGPDEPQAATEVFFKLKGIDGESRDAPSADGEPTTGLASAQPESPGALVSESGGPGEPEPAVDVFLKLPDIAGETQDAPEDGGPSTDLAGAALEPAASSDYLQVELKDALVSSYGAADDDSPSTLVELGEASEDGEAAAQYQQSDMSFLAERAQALPDADELEEPEL